MKLTVSREVPVKIASHAWNVVPLECFGILLGTTDPLCLFAALPVSHTAHWKEFTDRWTGIQEAIPKARALAAEVNTDVIGFYASTEDTARDAYPLPPWLAQVPAGLFLLYFTLCCKSCSVPAYYYDGRWLRKDDDYQECKGKRLDKAINQRRILSRWTALVGGIDYSNHVETEYPRVHGKPLPFKPAKRSKRSRENKGLIRLVWPDLTLNSSG